MGCTGTVYCTQYTVAYSMNASQHASSQRQPGYGPVRSSLHSASPARSPRARSLSECKSLPCERAPSCHEVPGQPWTQPGVLLHAPTPSSSTDWEEALKRWRVSTHLVFVSTHAQIPKHEVLCLPYNTSVHPKTETHRVATGIRKRIHQLHRIFENDASGQQESHVAYSSLIKYITP